MIRQLAILWRGAPRTWSEVLYTAACLAVVLLPVVGIVMMFATQKPRESPVSAVNCTVRECP